MEFTISREVALPYEQAVARVREELATVGFGVLTEIDMQATLKTKLDVDIAPKLILGACRPQLAHKAVTADPRIAAMLPCNVVVSGVDDATSTIEVFDPVVMTSFVDDAELAEVAADARERLVGMVEAVAT